MDPKAYEFELETDALLRGEFLRTARLGGRFRWLLLRRATDRRTVPLFGRRAALRQKVERFQRPRALRTAAGPCQWLPVGPRNINGRIRCLAVDPTNGNVVYAGAADGGVWKTTDGGQSWRALTDDQDSLAIGALAIDPSAPDTVYAGTGEPLLSPTLGPYGWSYPGIGVLRTTDGGTTWSVLGTIPNQFIYRIAVDPHDPSNVLCAGYAIGGGGGLCRWDVTQSHWMVAQPGSFTDVVFDPVTAGVAYAGEYGGVVWKSIDSGAVWNPRANGLAGTGRVSLTISPQQPAILHARIESTGLVYRTTTAAEVPGAGNAWTPLPDPKADLGPSGVAINQRYWCSFVAADPADPQGEIVYVGGVDLVRRERDGMGQLVWTRISRTYDPPTPAWVTHADLHDLAFVPGDSSRFYVASDGGVFAGKVSAPGTVPPVEWRKVSTGLAAVQFYDLATSAMTPSMFGGGCQDNGTIVTTSALTWRHVYGGDGSYLAFHSTVPWTIWAVRWDGGAIVQRSKDGGATFQDAQGTLPDRITGGGVVPVVPLAMDPATPATLFAGTDRVWRTQNGDADPPSAVSWTDRTGPLTAGGVADDVTEITIASSSEIYVGTMLGHLHVSTSAGNAFTDVTPTVAGWPTRWLSGITVRPGAPPTIFVTFHGFNGGAAASDHVWTGVLGPGGVWTVPMASIASNLPNAPVSALVVDPTTPTTLYVATDVGVFRSLDEGASWDVFDEGLPNVAVIDLAVDPGRQLLRAATHGRSMFQRLLAPSCPTVDLYLRDNVVDTGEVLPSPSGVWDPTRPGEHAYHWQSADIKVDAPPLQPVDALVDGVEFDNPTHRPIPFGGTYPIETVLGITHENPIRTTVNRVYVQAHNRGPAEATGVDVRLLWADASAALPPLPADFWTGFVNDSYSQTVWRLIGKQQNLTLRAGEPRVVWFDWTPPATASDHVCLLAMVDGPGDPLLPETELVVDVLTRSNKRVTHRNVHPVNVLTRIANRRVAWPWLRLHNPFETARPFTVRVETSVAEDWTVAMVVPRVELEKSIEASLYGFRPLSIGRAQQHAWLEKARASGAVSAPLAALLSRLDDPLVLVLEDGGRPAELRGVVLHPDQPVPAVFVATQPSAAPPARLRLDVLQLDGDRLLGGSTFLIGRDDGDARPGVP
jgi:hypothetical protein